MRTAIAAIWANVGIVAFKDVSNPRHSESGNGSITSGRDSAWPVCLSPQMIPDLWYNSRLMADLNSITRRRLLAWLACGGVAAAACVWAGSYAYTTWLERSFDPKM